MKNAAVVCETFNVLCPYCGGFLPAVHGSHLWTVTDFEKQPPKRKCVDCLEEFRLVKPSKAIIELSCIPPADPR